jgi:hypothetical protein
MNVQTRSLSHHRRVLATANPNWDPDGAGLAIVAAYEPKGAATYAASLQNLADPGTNDATEGTAPAWDTVNGWKFTAGSSHYLIGPAITKDSTVLAQFTNRGTVNWSFVFGMRNAASQDYGVQPYNNGAYNFKNNSNHAKAGSISSGNLAIAGTLGGYKNGALDTADGFTGVGSGLALYIGAFNNKGGGASGYWTGYLQALYIYSTALSSAEVLTVYTAMAAL